MIVTIPQGAVRPRLWTRLLLSLYIGFHAYRSLLVRVDPRLMLQGIHEKDEINENPWMTLLGRTITLWPAFFTPFPIYEEGRWEARSGYAIDRPDKIVLNLSHPHMSEGETHHRLDQPFFLRIGKGWGWPITTRLPFALDFDTYITVGVVPNKDVDDYANAAAMMSNFTFPTLSSFYGAN